MGTIKTTNIEPIADNGTVTLGSSGDTFTVPSGVTVNMSSATQTGVGGVNTPSFHAKTTSDISVANGTNTELVFPSEDFDTASAYDTSNGRFTPQTAGKYLIVSCIVIKVIADGSETMLQIRKNGAFNDNAAQKDLVGKNNYNSNLSASTIVELNGSSDYVSIFCYHDGGANKNVQGSFGAFKIIGA